jgi:hypothetical protein
MTTRRDEMQKEWAHWAGEAHNAMAKLFELVVEVQNVADEAVGEAQIFSEDFDEGDLPDDVTSLLQEANVPELLERVEALEDFDLGEILESIADTINALDDGTHDPCTMKATGACSCESCTAAYVEHTVDSDCTLDYADTCVVCRVYHGDPCPECGGRGFHVEGCSEVGEVSE